MPLYYCLSWCCYFLNPACCIFLWANYRDGIISNTSLWSKLTSKRIWLQRGCCWMVSMETVCSEKGQWGEMREPFRQWTWKAGKGHVPMMLNCHILEIEIEGYRAGCHLWTKHDRSGLCCQGGGCVTPLLYCLLIYLYFYLLRYTMFSTDHRHG